VGGDVCTLIVILAPSVAVVPPGPRKAVMTEQRQLAECGPRAKAAPPVTKNTAGETRRNVSWL